MVTRALRVFVIGLAAAAAPLTVSACELIAGVHNVTLVGVGTGEADGGGDASADGADGAVEATAPQCGAYTGPTYFVDPVVGDDTTGTGSPDCKFQTITAAVHHLGAHPAAGTIVVVADQAQITAPPEMFPITVPENVVIKAPSRATVSAPTGVGPPASVFFLSARDSGLENLIIDGSRLVDGALVAGIVASGIEVGPGSDGTTYIKNVQVRYMGAQGILVDAVGTVTLKSGVSSSSNGLPRGTDAGCNPPAPLAPPGDGLVVYGKATIDNQDLPLQFDNNANSGIWVRNSGSLTVPGGPGNFFVSAEYNYHGLTITQTPGDAPVNDIASLQVTNSGGNGIEVTAGSSLKLRYSQSVGNGGHGILVMTPTCSGGSVVSGIDLGVFMDPGLNTFQANAGSGICLSLKATTSKTLSAEGNAFTQIDCATTPGTLEHVMGKCASNTDYGVLANNSTVNIIDLGQCN